MIHRIGDRRPTAQAVPLPSSLDQAACYRYCEALCRAHSHNFPVASFFARSTLRQHIFAIFAFARVADDFADELTATGAQRIVAVDASAWFSRPGPRLVEGLEALAHVLHPDRAPEAPGPVFDLEA